MPSLAKAGLSLDSESHPGCPLAAPLPGYPSLLHRDPLRLHHLAVQWRATYLYGMCLLPLTRARMTLPRADSERHSPEPPSRFLLSAFTQLPRSMRCRRLRPPDTGTGEKKRGKKREWVSLGLHIFSSSCSSLGISEKGKD